MPPAKRDGPPRPGLLAGRLLPSGGRRGDRIGFVVGDLVDCETMVLVKEPAASARRMSMPPGRHAARRCPLAATSSTRPSPASSRRMLPLIGTNPRPKQPPPGSTPAARRLQGGADRHALRPHLSGHRARRRRADSGRAGRRPAQLRRRARAGGTAHADPGPGAADPCGRCRRPRPRRAPRRALRHGQRGLERFQRPAHRGRPRRRPRSRAGAGGRRQDRRRDGRTRSARRGLPDRADDRHLRPHTPSPVISGWRSRRAADGLPGAATRARHLREHRGPARGPARGLPPGRPKRTGRSCGMARWAWR